MIFPGDNVTKMNFANVILVIIYNKSLCDSKTLDTISNYNFPNSKLVIHNNGPEEVIRMSPLWEKLNKCFYSQIELINCLYNKPLSIIYNDIFVKYQACNFVILDDDTEISESFVYAMKNNNVDLELPKIKSSSDELIYYPICDGIVTNELVDLDPRKVLSIGSGLIINQALVDKFKTNNLKLFDESYALYGVDFSLFRRIYKIVDLGEVVKIRSSCFLTHSLSRLDMNENRDSFRARERALDLAISTRRYPTINLYYMFLRKIVGESIKMRYGNVYCMIKAYILGMHPRCSK